MGEKTTGQKGRTPIIQQAIPRQSQRMVVNIAKLTKGFCLWFWFFRAGHEEVSNVRAATGREEQSMMEDPCWTLVHLFSVLARESPTGLSEFQVCTSWTLWISHRLGYGSLQLYSHVRKLSLSSLVAANTDSTSKISELSASCRLGISSSPSMFIASPSSVPRSTFVPGRASR